MHNFRFVSISDWTRSDNTTLYILQLPLRLESIPRSQNKFLSIYLFLNLNKNVNNITFIICLTVSEIRYVGNCHFMTGKDGTAAYSKYQNKPISTVPCFNIEYLQPMIQ